MYPGVSHAGVAACHHDQLCTLQLPVTAVEEISQYVVPSMVATGDQLLCALLATNKVHMT